MKHSPPSIRAGVEAMVADGIERAVALVLAPHYSALSVGTYIERVRGALQDLGIPEEGKPRITFVREWYRHPAYLEVLAAKVDEARLRLTPAEREGALVLFTAHSLPARILDDGDPYPEQLAATADLVGSRLELPAYDVAWQSAGRTPEPWLGPDLTNAIRSAAARGHPAVVVCPCGFVADHLEILYDVDLEAQAIARDEGVRLVRTEMMNADTGFVEALAEVVRDHLKADPRAA
jgi:protoporphyrin/coproporphyrin ferrochelatase